MKKLILSSCFIAASLLSYAGENTIRHISKPLSKTIISKGFYLNLGVGFPKLTHGSLSQNTGTQFSLEVGNQFYFFNTEKIGIGMKVSWLQFGYGSRTESIGLADYRVGIYDLRLCQLGPQFTYALNEDMAVDISVQAMYGFLVQHVTGDVEEKGYVYGGLQVVPGARFRYNMFAVGFDATIGSVSYLGSDDIVSKDSQGFIMPRVYVGFKF